MTPDAARGRIGDLTEKIDHQVDRAGDVDWTGVAQAGAEITRVALEHAPAPSALELVGLAEIADYYAISRQLAAKWTSRSDFPAPLAELRQGKVWDMAAVITWGSRHGRVKGGGPGAPKGAPAG